MNDRLRRISRVVLILAVVVLAGMIYLRTAAGTLNGWWLKESGGGGRDSYPEQMTLRVSHGNFLMRSWDSSGVRSVMCPIDGQGHTVTSSDPSIGTVLSSTWWAELRGNTLLLTKKFEMSPPEKFQQAGKFEHVWTETWVVAEDGRHLTISVPGSQDIVYVRSPWWAYLWRSAP